MSATSAPAVKEAVKKLLEESSEKGNAFKGVQISYAHPGLEIQQESAYFHRTFSTERAVALGDLRRDEDYYIELILDVVKDNNEPAGTEQRCWELVEEVESLIRANPGRAGDAMSGLVKGWVVYGGTEMLPEVLGNGSQWLAEATCKIEVKNRK